MLGTLPGTEGALSKSLSLGRRYCAAVKVHELWGETSLTPSAGCAALSCETLSELLIKAQFPHCKMKIKVVPRGLNET